MSTFAMNCLITGVGGQGTVLMSRLIGAAALARGWKVRGAETIGMAQRGGSVVSHIRFGSRPIHSPLAPPGTAGLIIALEPAEALRTLAFLAPNGSMLALDRGIAPALSPQGGAPYDPALMLEQVRKFLGETRLTVICGEDLIGRLPSARYINTALLGAAAEKLLPFTLDELSAVIKERLPEKTREMNEQALRIGAAIHINGP